MAKLNFIIPPQNFELIKNKIGEILADELSNQAALLTDDSINATVWVSRFVPFDKTEMPAINVSFINGAYDNKDRLSIDGAYVYAIDVLTRKGESDVFNGGSQSVSVGEKVAGICRAILENPIYKTLDIVPPFLCTTKIATIEGGDPFFSQHNAENASLVRLAFNVRVVEKVPAITPITFKSGVTGVKLELTEKGYKYITEE